MSSRTPEIKIHTHPLSLVQDRARLRSVQRGELIHLALFFLDYYCETEDIERAILQAFSLLGHDRKHWDIEKEYLTPLVTALSLPEVKSWFARGVKSLREVEVVDVQGEVHRIDRLVIGDTVHEVVDFKVGSREAEHRTQVELYQRLVSSVFHQPTKGWLIYVDEPAVVAVP